MSNKRNEKIWMDQMVTLQSGNGKEGRFTEVTAVTFWKGWKFERNDGNSNSDKIAGTSDRAYACTAFETLDASERGSYCFRINAHDYPITVSD